MSGPLVKLHKPSLPTAWHLEASTEILIYTKGDNLP
jgi:hypothetical protein